LPNGRKSEIEGRKKELERNWKGNGEEGVERGNALCISRKIPFKSPAIDERIFGECCKV